MLSKFGQNKFRAEVAQVFSPQLIVPTGKHFRPNVAFGKANIELSCAAETALHITDD